MPKPHAAPRPAPPPPPSPAKAAPRGRRRALLIGINHYPHFPPERQLAGCVNDVEVMSSLLRDRFDFPADQVTVLTDGHATRAGILAAMERLLAASGPGDSVLFHFSGHGSRAPSLDPNEPGGMDETILPHDTAHDGSAANLDIHDKQIRSWLQHLTLRTDNVVLFFDACHSAGITRDSEGAVARWAEPDKRPAQLLPVPWAAEPPAAAVAAAANAAGRLPVDERYVLIAGCRNEECSFEIAVGSGSATRHGALTYYLCRSLTSAGAETTYLDLFQGTAVEVSGHFTLQHPQLEGQGDRRLFGVDRIEPMRFAAVRERDAASPGDAEVVLAAGAAMNLTAGSEWAVYPAGTHHLGHPPPQRLGTIAITSVAGITSTARIVAEKHHGAITAGARAVEECHDYGDLAPCVAVAPRTRGQAAGDELAAALAVALAASKMLRPAPAGVTPDATVHLLPARAAGTATTADDPVPQVATLAEPSWAVVGRAGELILPLARVSRNDSSWVVERLEALTRYRVALSLQSDGVRLRDAIRCTLLRQAPGGAWKPVVRRHDALPLFREGERLAFELENRSDTPLHVYVLDLGLTGRIELVYPPVGGDTALAAHRTIRFGTSPGEQMELGMPEEYPFDRGAAHAHAHARARAAAGQETLKVIATLAPADLRLLRQDPVAVRGAGDPSAGGEARSAGGPLDLLLGMVGGEPVRDVAVRRNLAADEWTVTDCLFLLRRGDAAAT